MKLVLISMIKNESKIIERSLKSVEGLVDAFCVCDTGSTDNTVEIVNKFLETHTGCLTVEPWKNFGYNRTISFQRARNYVRDTLKWNLAETYGLLLDADMVFVSGTLKSYPLKEIGYSVVQKNGHISYHNCRLVRFDYEWKCAGVTHEYWDGPAHNNIPESVCYIDDRNDGGCKGDKIPRDIRLLEQGLKDEPQNGRYMFYLAQSYKDCGRFDDAIKMYKKRIKAGGWDEEIWYSHYTIGQCHLALKNVFKFEQWMQKAHALRPSRGEPLYALSEFFRVNGRNYKAYQYIQVGREIPYPNDVLFVENFCHKGGFDYEASIVEYYVNPDRKSGLRSSFKYLLQNDRNAGNVVSNMKFYIPSASSDVKTLNLPKPFEEPFTPSAISVIEYPYANVRYVNYRIQPDGSYTMPNGIVETRNAYVNLETNEYKIIKDPIPVFESHIRGLEDMRVSKNSDGKYYFTATSYKQYIQDKISIVHGEYDSVAGEVRNYRGIHSPLGQDCEKNWVCFPNTDTYIYSWNPMRIGKIVGNQFKVAITYETPPLFSHFRGSAPPVRVDDNWVVLVHFVEYCTPRKYYHCFVELDSKFKPQRISLPFYFRENRIEFCVSVVYNDNNFDCYASMNDCNPARIRVPVSSLEWMNVNTKLIEDNPISSQNCSLVRVAVEKDDPYYWFGELSKCCVNGQIEQYILECLNKHAEKSSLLFFRGDGFLRGWEYPECKSKCKSDTVPIIASLCSRKDHKSVLYTPLDDDTFTHGLTAMLSKHNKPNWYDRKSIAFWRGVLSGCDTPTLRERVIKHLLNNPNTDVKPTPSPLNEYRGMKDIQADRCSIEKHFEYKYILIIDGNIIASNHQWVFGSGAVPIMVTHPDNKYWFSKFLKPMTTYVPIKYDLSDLDEKIQWLVDNDDKAKEIAENALKFSQIIFSSEFQKTYIRMEISELMKEPPYSNENKVIKDSEDITQFWNGPYSRCMVNGAIHNFVNSLIANTNIHLKIPMSDGIVDRHEYNRLREEVKREPDALRIDNNDDLITGMLCSRYVTNKRALYLPLDDDTFQHGLNHVLSNIHSPAWDSRIPKVFWRGGTSGYDRPMSTRVRVVNKLLNNINADVRIVRNNDPRNENYIPNSHFGDRCGLDKHFLHKYILIVDGNCIASNHQWVFGSGAVPIMVTHPHNDYWFKKYLKPMVNYVPIRYDLEDIDEKLQWLVDNDDKAQEIANNAMKLANTIFTPRFQQWYLRSELKRITMNETSILKTEYLTKQSIPSDINEHLITLYEYASKCDSIIECGVCNICSSYAFASGLLGNKNNKFTMIDPFKDGFVDSFVEHARSEGINVQFIEGSDIKCERSETDLLFIDTIHVYGQLKRELEYWNTYVKKYIIMHDTTSDEWVGEIVRGNHNAHEFSKKLGIPVEDLNKGLWPAIDEFLKEHPEWRIEKRLTNNNGLTILKRS